MSELQATMEFCIELYKFYNVDLFQRGFYQIRTALKVSPKLPVKVEVNLPRVAADFKKTESVFPACVVNGSGVSKTFQILYRNEEVLLDDVLTFRAHILVDSHKIEETLERADFQLTVELWFTDQSFGPDQHSSIACVSARTLQLNFSPTRGLHYHLPVLFDYFHLAAVTLTIHASLVALHQPYINTPRSSKTWLGGSQRFNFRPPQSTMETVFFGQLNTNKCVGSGSSRIAHARHVHREVCSILLASFEALQAKLHEFMRLLPAWQQLRLEKADCMSRFSTLSDLAKDTHHRSNLLYGTYGRSATSTPPWERLRTVDGEEEFVALANSDIAQLCAENILLWQQFLEAFSCKEPVHQHLARLHHQLRVKRFAEAFFVVDNPRQSAGGCYDANYQSYLAVSEAARRSRYLAMLPPLPVSCAELDGELTTMPVIFEDQYQDVAEFARRRSVAGRKAGSDPFLSTSTGELEKEGTGLGGGSLTAISSVSAAPVVTPSATPAPPPQTAPGAIPEDCSCGIAAILESRSHKVPQVVKAGHAPGPAVRPRPSLANVSDVSRLIPTSSAPNSATTSRDELLLAATFAAVVRPSSSSQHAGPGDVLRATLTLTPRPWPSHAVTDTNTLPGLRRSVPSHSKSLDQLKTGAAEKRPTLIDSPPPPVPAHAPQQPPPLRAHTQGGGTAGGRARAYMARSSSTQIRREPSEEERTPTQQASRQKEKERIKNALRLDLQSIHNGQSSSSAQLLPKHHHQPISNGHHSSSDSNGQNSSDSTALLSGCRRLETSASVPFALSETLRHSQSTMSVPAIYWRGITDLNSESMPNLAAPPPSSPHSSSPPTLPLSAPPIPSPSEKPFPPFPTGKIKAKKLDLSSSASDITSEQSGWVSNSSRRSSRDVSSGQLSPEEFINNNNNNNNNNSSKNIISHNNKLIINDMEDEDDMDIDESNHKILNGAQLRAKLEELKQLSTKTNSSNTQQQKQLTPPPNTAQALMQFQAKHPYEEVPLPPPKQFRDPPLFARPKEPMSLPGTLMPPPRGPKLPPEQFRDPPRGLAKRQAPQVGYKPPEPFHVYESLTDFKAAELRLARPDLLMPGHTSTLPPKLPDKSAAITARQLAEKTAAVAARLQVEKTANARQLAAEKQNAAAMRQTPPSAAPEPPVSVALQRSSNVMPASPQRTSPSPKGDRKTCSCPSDPLLPPPGAPSPQHASCECYAETKESGEERLRQKLNNSEDEVLNFLKYRDDFKRQMNFSGMLYSDFPTLASTLPYFHISDEYRIFSPEGLHLIVCVHGLDGNSADLRLVKTYLEMGMPGANLEFLMSERNQGDTFSDFDTMTDKLVAEILFHVGACSLNPAKISFIGHSLGNIIIRSAITRPQMKPLLPKLHTFLSLSGPHLGTLYNTSGLVNMGMWFMQKWKKSGSLLQLSLRDAADVRQTFLYRLSQKSNIHHFKNILLCGSSQDRYVPCHSSRIELCKAAVRDTSVQGAVYREMVHNILNPIINKPEVTFVRYDVHHALPNTANSLIGRAAHIAVLDSELFIEKFLVVTGLKYFR